MPIRGIAKLSVSLAVAAFSCKHSNAGENSSAKGASEEQDLIQAIPDEYEAVKALAYSVTFDEKQDTFHSICLYWSGEKNGEEIFKIGNRATEFPISWSKLDKAMESRRGGHAPKRPFLLRHIVASVERDNNKGFMECCDTRSEIRSEGLKELVEIGRDHQLVSEAPCPIHLVK